MLSAARGPGGGGLGETAARTQQLPAAPEQISFKANGRADLLETKLSVLSAKETEGPLTDATQNRRGRCVLLGYDLAPPPAPREPMPPQQLETQVYGVSPLPHCPPPP